MSNMSARGLAYVLLGLSVLFFRPAQAQEKKNLRVVFVSLSWNAQLPFRIAQHRGFLRSKG